MIKKSKIIVLTLTLPLLALMPTACGNEHQMGAWIDNHIEKSSDRLEKHIQESQNLVGNDDTTEGTRDDSEQPQQQLSNWIVNHIRDAGDKLIQHIERSEDRLDSITGKD